MSQSVLCADIACADDTKYMLFWNDKGDLIVNDQRPSQLNVIKQIFRYNHQHVHIKKISCMR